MSCPARKCDSVPEGCKDTYPEDWTDPLELYGIVFRDLVVRGAAPDGPDLENERVNVLDLVRMFGARWVWCNRARLFPW